MYMNHGDKRYSIFSIRRKTNRIFSASEWYISPYLALSFGFKRLKWMEMMNDKKLK